MKVCYCTLPSTDPTACSRCSVKGMNPDWPARPIIKGRYIVTEEYFDGALKRRKVEMPDDGIVMVSP